MEDYGIHLKKGSRCSDVALSIGNSRGDTNLYDKLAPGDILLTRTHGIFYALWRKLSCTLYDHSAVVLEDNETMNVVYPVTKKLPASHFFRSGKSPMVLRPVWKNGEQTREFLRSMRRLEGTHYNSFRGIINISNMMIYYRLGLKIPLKIPALTSRRWVCTDAILMHLHNIVPGFSGIGTLDLDLFRFGFTSPNDFLRIAYYRPDILKKVG
ncbi:MAG: hypothetical protein M1491_06270 [Deltaproteobacteria bacterium]|nr:hypothetical protein [Deltaproteobacteria bacterium]MCL5276645.1 hypothetical protein [Deltaproteobacteria bacterium]